MTFLAPSSLEAETSRLSDTLTLWEAAMRLIEGQPRGNRAELGDEQSDYPPDTADKLAWLATDPRSTPTCFAIC